MGYGDIGAVFGREGNRPPLIRFSHACPIFAVRRRYGP